MKTNGNVSFLGLYVVLCDNILEAVNGLFGLSQLPTSRNHDALIMKAGA